MQCRQIRAQTQVRWLVTGAISRVVKLRHDLSLFWKIDKHKNYVKIIRGRIDVVLKSSKRDQQV